MIMVRNNAYFFRPLSFGVIFNTVVTEPWCLDYIRKGAIEELLRESNRINLTFFKDYSSYTTEEKLGEENRQRN